MKTSSYPMYVVFYDGDSAAVLKRRGATVTAMPIYEIFEAFDHNLAGAGERALELTRQEKKPE